MKIIVIHGYSDWLKDALGVFSLLPTSTFSLWYGKYQQMQSLEEFEWPNAESWDVLLGAPVFENFRPSH
jgi:hypothetical protein